MEESGNLVCKLSGYNTTGLVEICKWTSTPVKFIGDIKARFISMVNQHGNVAEGVEDKLEKCITLRELEKLVEEHGNRNRINKPVFVHVIGKKKVSVIVKFNKMMIISTLVVADKSGYAVICSFNEGYETMYSHVEIGDCLLLTSCSYNIQRPYRDRQNRVYHQGLFAENMYLELEIKMAYYDVKYCYIKKFCAAKLSEFKFPDMLFDTAFKLKLPNELEKEFESKEKPPWITPEIQYYDVVGVVSYVSRTERYNNQENFVECRGEGRNETFKRFVVYRWVYLIDKTSKPLPVKLYNLPLPQQKVLIPGAIVVISHCNKIENTFQEPHVSVSDFSQMYIGDDSIESYIMSRPCSLVKKIQELISRQNYFSIIMRTDICWSIGGMPTVKISSEDAFRDFYKEKVKDMDLPLLSPQESHRQYFIGRVLRVFKIENEARPKVWYIDSRYPELKKQKLKYKVLEHPLPQEVDKSGECWYTFMRKLPAIKEADYQHTKCRDVVRAVVNGFKTYCDPLQLGIDLSNEGLPRMADLERLDGPPYFYVDIVDEEHHRWFRCVWKSRAYSLEDLNEKLDSAKGNAIIGLVEVFYLENSPLEVTLHDFVIDM